MVHTHRGLPTAMAKYSCCLELLNSYFHHHSCFIRRIVNVNISPEQLTSQKPHLPFAHATLQCLTHTVQSACNQMLATRTLAVSLNNATAVSSMISGTSTSTDPSASVTLDCSFVSARAHRHRTCITSFMGDCSYPEQGMQPGMHMSYDLVQICIRQAILDLWRNSTLPVEY